MGQTMEHDTRTVREFCQGPRNKTFATVIGSDGSKWRAAFIFTPQSAYGGYCNLRLARVGGSERFNQLRYVEYERATLAEVWKRWHEALADGARIELDAA